VALRARATARLVRVVDRVAAERFDMVLARFRRLFAGRQVGRNAVRRQHFADDGFARCGVRRRGIEARGRGFGRGWRVHRGGDVGNREGKLLGGRIRRRHDLDRAGIGRTFERNGRQRIGVRRFGVVVFAARAARALEAHRFLVLLGHQRLPVGDRDAVIVRVDFVEREEPVTVAAELDERRLQRRLDARHAREIDVALELLLAGGFEIEFVQLVSVENDHAGFFRVGRVDQHTFSHRDTLLRMRRRSPGCARRAAECRRRSRA
jgi:hypothetical protein